MEPPWVTSSVVVGGNLSKGQMSVLKGFSSFWGKLREQWVLVMVIGTMTVWFSHCPIYFHQLVIFFFFNNVGIFSFSSFSTPPSPGRPSGFCLYSFSFHKSTMKNGGKKTLDLCLVPHFRCKDSYPIDSKWFLLRYLFMFLCNTMYELGY